MKFKLITILLLTATLACSCTKEDPEIISMDQQKSMMNVNKDDKIDLLINDYSFIVAKALTIPEFRFYLQKTAMTEFDGDYDVLVHHIHHNTTEPFSTMATIFKEMYSKYLEPQNKTPYEDFIKDIEEIIPNLQISVPVNCEEWDCSNYTPYVVSVPTNFENSKQTKIKATNGYDDAIEISLLEDPSFPVVVVSISERVDKKLQCTFKPGVIFYPFHIDTLIPTNLDIKNKYSQQLELTWKRNPNATLYKILRLSNTGYVEIAQTTDNYYIDYNLNPQRYDYRIVAVDANGNTSTSPSIGRHASPRNIGSDLTISTIKFNNTTLAAVEPWIWGKPELKIRIIGTDTHGNESIIITEATLSYKRKELCESDCTIDLNILNWNPNILSNIVICDWQEEDPIKNIETEISAQIEGKYDSRNITLNNSCKFKISSNGQIYRTPIHFWDSLTKRYGSTGFYFKTITAN